MVLTLIGLFILGRITIREKKYSYLGWGFLTLALCIIIFTIPNGIHLIDLVIVSALVTISSYFAFSYKQIISKSAYIWNILFFIIFISHALVISSPHTFGINVEENRLASDISEVFNKKVEMTPVEFSQTDKGREVVIQNYNISPFTPQEEIEKLIEDNPEPLISYQESLKLLGSDLEDNPYIYILNIYLHAII
jgi:hypothetical protein